MITVSIGLSLLVTEILVRCPFARWWRVMGSNNVGTADGFQPLRADPGTGPLRAHEAIRGNVTIKARHRRAQARSAGLPACHGAGGAGGGCWIRTNVGVTGDLQNASNGALTCGDAVIGGAGPTDVPPPPGRSGSSAASTADRLRAHGRACARCRRAWPGLARDWRVVPVRCCDRPLKCCDWLDSDQLRRAPARPRGSAPPSTNWGESADRQTLVRWWVLPR